MCKIVKYFLIINVFFIQHVFSQVFQYKLPPNVLVNEFFFNKRYVKKQLMFML